MFQKYNSIENTYQKEFLDRIKGHGFWEKEYVIQEKAHGSNLSYRTNDGINFTAAKRTGNISPEEVFYNYDVILEDLKPQFGRVWTKLMKKYFDLEQMTIFGEIIGGDYPHIDVEENKKAIRVQKGIYYSPGNQFYIFDILVNNNKYINTLELNEYLEEENLLHANTLFKGKIAECLDYPNNFESTIPVLLGLPPLKHNVCEGVVIRPVNTSYFNNGVRVILKNKNNKWSENKKFNKSIKKEEKLTDKTLKLQEAIQTYVTENRLNNVISKIGEVRPQDYGRVLGMFNKDIVESFINDYHQYTDDLEKKELKLITKCFFKESQRLVQKKLN